ncbi:MAG: acyl--CoA ligase [Clostridiales bacterium]|nr:MAG: acyl--CoA ligase [Clostridiales bacterium]
MGIDNANVKSCEKVCEEIRLDPFDFDTKETEKSVVQRLMENALINPNDVAIIANEKETTYGELADMIVSVRNWLYENGARKGDCIAVQAIHEDICIALYYAIHLSGAKLVPVEKSAVQDRIREIALETKCKLIVSLKEENEEIWHSYDEVRSISHTIKFNGELRFLYPDLDLPCEMIFTTGTTGKSKGVLMTHRHISWYAYSVAKGIGMKRQIFVNNTA